MRPRRLKAEINVVPYIDVMLVLLVIFMVTAPMMNTASIDLPSVGKATEVKTPPIEIAIRADLSMTLTDRAGKGDALPFSARDLDALVRTVRAAQERQPEQPVLIAGDRSVKYEAVLQVMDKLQRAQIKRIGLLVQPTGK